MVYLYFGLTFNGFDSYISFISSSGFRCGWILSGRYLWRNDGNAHLFLLMILRLSWIFDFFSLSDGCIFRSFFGSRIL